MHAVNFQILWQKMEQGVSVDDKRHRVNQRGDKHECARTDGAEDAVEQIVEHVEENER